MESSRLNAERVSLLEGRPREFQCSNFFKGWKFFLQSTVTKVQAMHIHTYIYTHMNIRLLNDDANSSKISTR